MDKKQTIAYLGPAGTYSDEAARLFAKRMGIEPELIECPSFNVVFENVERGKAAFGVVPTENSIEGAVTSTLDNFASADNISVLGEQVLAIHHCLLMQPGSSPSDATAIASHPQGLAQCRRYINAHYPNLKPISTSSTAESAKLAAGDPHIIGIANSFAADLYGAEVVEADIEDHSGNETSFALISSADAAPVFEGDRYKTSLALFLRVDKAGALLMILSEFAYAGINLTMIQSRPTKRALGDYMFFVDIEGATTDPDVQTALNCLRLKLRDVKVLGSYPVE